MRFLFATSCLTPIAVLALPAHAQLVIDTTRTTSVATSSANNGAAADIRIAAAGVVRPTGGTAVTIDSGNAVTNEGLVQITDANDAIGILANAGITGAITNTGRIIIDETYAPTDADTDGDIDGPLASGARRFGIRTAGAFTGAISHGGTITVEGNDSAGLALDGPLNGALTHNGTTTVTGDRSYGVRAGAITGNVRLAGSIAAAGAGAVGAALDGDIGGALVVQGGIASTGYRNTTPPADTSKLDADDLLQGGPALRITGNVAGGIQFAVPPADANATDPDEDKDGIPDASEGSAAITSYGAAPAVAIGAASRDVAIGAVAGQANGHGIVVAGQINGNGVYRDVAATGMAIGGQGGAVSVAGGLTVSGTVGAASSGASATALRIGDRATVAEIRNSGTITATGGSAAGVQTGAIVIDAGASVATIRNTGTIRATGGGGEAGAAAILDRSGTVRLVENGGGIAASAGAVGRTAAIDLSAATAGVVVRQTVAAQGVAAPAISGDVLLSTGDDLFEIQDGAVSGIARFGAGANRLIMSGDAVYAGQAVFGSGNDSMTLAGTSVFGGTADFGGGADTLTLAGTAQFSGTLAGGAGLSVNVGSGRLVLANGGAVPLAALSVGTTGAIGVNIDAAAGTSTLYQVSGAASFAQGSRLEVRLANVGQSEGRYVVVRAGTLTGGTNLTADGVALPFLFKSAVSASDATGEIALEIARKNAEELGLNRSQASAYDAVFAALDQDERVADAVLEIEDGDAFRRTLRQMLPDHAGGTFEAVTSGSRATARLLADPRAPIHNADDWGFWLQQVAWGTSKSLGDTASYDVSGWGASGGGEIRTEAAGSFGLSLAYLAGSDNDGGSDNAVDSTQYELAAHWRGQWGGLNAFARASAAYIDFDSSRRFQATAGGEAVGRSADGSWNGRLYSAAGGVAYAIPMGRLSLRPAATIDYYRLREGSYTETGGGDAVNLTVDARTSDEVAVSGTLTAAYDFVSGGPEGGFLRTELEGGRREIVGGALGATTARFTGGEDFTLTPEDRTSGWTGRLRLTGGNTEYSVGGEFSAEEQQDRLAIAFRASLQMGF